MSQEIQLDVLGMAGLAEVNPETGAFDLSIPSYGGTTVNIGHNPKSGNVQGGLGVGIKKFFEISINSVFNFKENAEESRRMRKRTEDNLERVMRMEDEK